MRVVTAIAILMFGLASRAVGQVERYELGLRLRVLESAWEKADAAGRSRALSKLKPVSRQFLTFQFGEAGRSLDEAAFALLAEPPSDFERWAHSLQVVPEYRLVDASVREIRVTVKPFYRSVYKPTGVRVRIGDSNAVIGDNLPVTLKLSLSNRIVGDQIIPVVVESENQRISRNGFLLSRVTDLNARIAKLKLSKVGEANSLERVTAIRRAKMFADIASGEIPDADLPLAKLLSEAEQWSGGKNDFATTNPGRFWLTVPTADGKQTPCRISVPPNLDRSKPIPVVLALHGAGGSEDLFFDGYGAGCVVAESEKRGWLTIAPRSPVSLWGGGLPPLGELIKTLAERYPLDRKRVFLIGHSMGAAHAIEAVQLFPGSFAAVAALGGGGRVRVAEAFTDLPTFIGVGTEDFARSGADSLHKALMQADKNRVTYKEYPEVEHLTVVRVAVEDVFRVFDETAQRTR